MSRPERQPRCKATIPNLNIVRAKQDAPIDRAPNNIDVESKGFPCDEQSRIHHMLKESDHGFAFTGAWIVSGNPHSGFRHTIIPLGRTEIAGIAQVQRLGKPLSGMSPAVLVSP